MKRFFSFIGRPRKTFLEASQPRTDTFVMDTSGSMLDSGFTKGFTRKEEIIKAVKGLLALKLEHRPADRVTLIAYSSVATVLCHELEVGRHYKKLVNAIQRFKDVDEAGTSMTEGLNSAMKLINAPRFGHAHRVIAYSDGHDFNSESAIAVSDSLKARGVLVETFGIARKTTDVDEEFLQSVATTDHLGTHYRFIGSADDLQETFTKLATGMLTMD